MEPQFIDWVTDDGIPYHQITWQYKLHILKGYQERYKCSSFIETGFYNGDTLLGMSGLFNQCWTIELNKEYLDRNRRKFDSIPHVHLLQGDSSELLPWVIHQAPYPILFWLDAHLENWKGPVVSEMNTIFSSGAKGVILVDDMDYITDILPRHKDWSYSIEYGIARFVHHDME